MVTSLMIFHAFISVILIVTVLMQFGKGAEAGLLSGGASDAVFSGSQKGNIMTKITTVLVIIFIGNCILLTKLQTGKEQKSLLDDEAPVARPLNSDAMNTNNAAPEAKATETKEAAPAETKTETK
ncbi:preprotein translocase subunit SecG [Halobacteriovorax sp. GB3]|uniref:preprotein translocase subunit SecG n=1 Tax=Halobacteriovorax sp. GB3 TaxID=2719615 RepID=UPI00235F296D|nr:preprotein translocase subunit SecG [Halobacteriovorax sp. GB3]MDD0851454.1 preprotein translocase subunit SecG [Halobacteriovorax sp. GB3]